MGWRDKWKGFLEFAFGKTAQPERIHNPTLREILEQRDREPMPVPAVPLKRFAVWSCVAKIISAHKLHEGKTNSQAAADAWNHIGNVIESTWQFHKFKSPDHDKLRDAIFSIAERMELAEDSDEEIWVSAESISDLTKYWHEISRTIEVLKVQPLDTSALDKIITPFRRVGEKPNAKDFPNFSPVHQYIKDMESFRSMTRSQLWRSFEAREPGDPGNDRR